MHDVFHPNASSDELRPPKQTKKRCELPRESLIAPSSHHPLFRPLIPKVPRIPRHRRTPSHQHALSSIRNYFPDNRIAGCPSPDQSTSLARSLFSPWWLHRQRTRTPSSAHAARSSRNAEQLSAAFFFLLDPLCLRHKLLPSTLLSLPQKCRVTIQISPDKPSQEESLDVRHQAPWNLFF